jgi:hypothetical protein
MLIGNITLHQIDTIVVVGILFILLIIAHIFGSKLRKFSERKGVIHQDTDLGTVEGALIGLFAFFLAFTFSMSGTRFDNRRETIIDEATKIGTALNLADLYPDSVRTSIRGHFKKYVDYRIAYFDAGIGDDKLNAALKNGGLQFDTIWAIVSHLGKDEKYSVATRLIAPALNEMSDIVVIRDAVKNATVPESILWVLFLLSICSSFMVGYGANGKNRNSVAGIVLATMISISIYLIIDLDKPRRGLITTEGAQEKIVELKSLFK